MTNHWRDIKNADVILINGANPAEAHPVGFQWFLKAKLDPARGPGSGGGARIVPADPRFARTSALADTYLRIRTGTDVAYFGGLINYVLQNNLFHDEYVRNYTNASWVVKDGYSFKDGLFSGYNKDKRGYDVSTWAYANAAPPANPGEPNASQGQGPATTGSDTFALRDKSLQDPHCVFQLMKAHYSRYTPEAVESITGIPRADFLKVAQMVGEMGKPDKVMSIVYAVGLTHHTTGGQLIRSAAVLQLLLGNVGRPGGGVNAERGHANIQGNTDNAISWEIFPGYLAVAKPGMNTMADYMSKVPSKVSAPNAVNYFGTNYKKFMVSMLKSWWGDAAQPDNDCRYSWLPKPAKNSSWLTIHDEARSGNLDGLFAAGMSGVNIGPDSNRMTQSLSKLNWLV